MFGIRGVSRGLALSLGGMLLVVALIPERGFTQSPEPPPTDPPADPEPPPPPPNSYDLIDEALANSQITAEQAAIYRVYASFSDPRLPASFRADGELPDSLDLFAEFDTLSPSTQALLAPFRLRPDHPDSWWYTTDAGAWPGEAAASATADIQAAARPAGPWLNVTGTKVRVHYPDLGPGVFGPTLATLAATIANAADKVVWPALFGLLDQEPPADCLLFCSDRGGSSHFDIYLVSTNRSSNPAEGQGCRGPFPSYMELNPFYGGQPVLGVLAHELMHAFQFSFPTGGSGWCGEYAWLQESTAQWAVEYVYKKEYNKQYEHYVMPWYLDHPRQPLEFRNDKHEYGAYIFFFYLTRIGASPDEIKSI